MKILIIGSAGILGRRFMSKYPENEYLIYKDRIENYRLLSEFIKNNTFDVVLHLAALVPRNEVEQNLEQAFITNVMGTYNVLESVRASGHRQTQIIFLSTSHVYQSRSAPIKEDDFKNPASWYGKTKLAAERLCEMYVKSFNMKISILRIFSYTDFSQSNEFFIPAMIEKIFNANRNETLFIPGLNEFRDFSTSDQIVTALEHFCRNPINSVVNVGTGKKVLLKHIVDFIIIYFNRSDLIILTDESNGTYASDCKKLESYGVKLENNLMDYLIEMMQLKI
jgi:nucleoside-diphosphate-sugar epimerase